MNDVVGADGMEGGDEGEEGRWRSVAVDPSSSGAS